MPGPNVHDLDAQDAQASYGPSRVNASVVIADTTPAWPPVLELTVFQLIVCVPLKWAASCAVPWKSSAVAVTRRGGLQKNGLKRKSAGWQLWRCMEICDPATLPVAVHVCRVPGSGLGAQVTAEPV